MTQRDYPTQEDEDRRTESPSKSHTAKFAGEEDKSLSVCVVEAVAEATETDPTDLQPLYDVIDPDALNRLFGTPHRPQQGYVMFRFEGCNITVDADGWIAVSPRMNDGE